MDIDGRYTTYIRTHMIISQAAKPPYYTASYHLYYMDWKCLPVKPIIYDCGAL